MSMESDSGNGALTACTTSDSRACTNCSKNSRGPSLKIMLAEHARKIKLFEKDYGEPAVLGVSRVSLH